MAAAMVNATVAMVAVFAVFVIMFLQPERGRASIYWISIILPKSLVNRRQMDATSLLQGKENYLARLMCS